jgi:hypothetical protein
METIRTQWNHTTKPSRFVVYKGDQVIFEGPYREGIQLFMDALNEHMEKNNLARKSEPHKTPHT